MAVYIQKGAANFDIREEELKTLVLDTIKATGKEIKKLLLLPPDHTRLNSGKSRQQIHL